MPCTVNACFEKFIQDTVNLVSERTNKARDSRDWLVLQIVNLANQGKIPPLYETSHIYYGSFARNTKIRPLDDIDLMVIFDAQGCTTTDVSKRERMEYPIFLNNPNAKCLPNYCDDALLNSRKMIEGIKKELTAIPTYSNADIHRNQEAVTLKLTSYEWNFDIIPAFYTTTDFYVIPDGQGSWKGTDPRIDQNRATSANKNWDGKLLPIIRLVKYWKEMYWGNKISSYLFENLIIDWANNYKYLRPTTYPEITKSILEYLQRNIMYDYIDYKGFQGNINDASFVDRCNLRCIVSNCLSGVYEAIQYERNYNYERAINKWVDIFKDKFPGYGK